LTLRWREPIDISGTADLTSIYTAENELEILDGKR